VFRALPVAVSRRRHSAVPLAWQDPNVNTAARCTAVVRRYRARRWIACFRSGEQERRMRRGVVVH
jgi:hypothetical protein